jgi:uncharacterized protein
MKYTLCITQKCNLACGYCYVAKRPATMSLTTARRVVDFLFRHAQREKRIEIGFFGGEPLLEFDLVRQITSFVTSHTCYPDCAVELSLVTNGTTYSEAIAAFLNDYDFKFCVSCDGPPDVQDTFRCARGGRGSAKQVESTISAALCTLHRGPLVNAVYHPRTFRRLPDTVE